MDFIIRELETGDFPAWEDLWRQYLSFYNTSLPEVVYQTAWQRLLTDDPQHFNGLVAVDGEGRLIGLTHYLFHRNMWLIDDVCYLQDLYVTEEARGYGAGRALIEAVYAAADHNDCTRVYWLTQEGNTTARALYDNVADVTDFIKYQRNFDNAK